MLRRATLLATLPVTVAVCGRALADDGPEDPEPAIEATFVVRGGVEVGHTTRPETYGVLEAQAETTPSVEWKWFRLGAPLEIAHQQTLGVSLSELSGSGGLELRLRLGPEFRFYVEGGVEGEWRPDWPDQYQPLANGELAPTDRYSNWTRGVGTRVAAIPIRHQHVDASYHYELTDYADDPNFNPVDEPTHLVPSDHEEHSVEFGWHHHDDDFKLGGGVAIAWRGYFFAFARDAGTGTTHAGPGGSPPNPLHNEWEIEPSVDAEFELADGHLEIDLAYGHEFLIDTFEGYESYHGPHPQVGFGWKPVSELELELDVEMRYRTFGSGSYRAGPGHPPLEEGDRRYDFRFSPGFEIAWEFAAGWSITAEFEYTMRRTNFPDYVPGVFPASRQYAIQWDYDNLRVVAGVALELETSDEE